MVNPQAAKASGRLQILCYWRQTFLSMSASSLSGEENKEVNPADLQACSSSSSILTVPGDLRPKKDHLILTIRMRSD
jgi:hypothetical protein